MHASSERRDQKKYFGFPQEFLYKFFRLQFQNMHGEKSIINLNTQPYLKFRRCKPRRKLRRKIRHKLRHKLRSTKS